MMLKKRLIAVLILRDGQVVQSVRFDHTNVIHYDPIHAVEAFNKWAVDELVMLNVSRDPEGRDLFAEKVASVSRHCFVPLTAGGWITDLDYAQKILRGGADKLVVNSVLADDPEFVTRLARRYGRQCIVGSLDAQRTSNGTARIAIDRGRRPVDADPVNWAKHAVELGCGELFFNSIDHDGARKGYDVATLGAICAEVDVPVIAFGGVFHWKHLVEGIEAGADGVAAANIFHYTEHATKKAKSFLARAGVDVRQEGQVRLGAA